MGRPLKIAMIGHKRFGSREGGVEVVVTELARRMAALGHDVTCYDRSGVDVMTGDQTAARESIVDGVRVVHVRTIDKKGLAALSSSFFCNIRCDSPAPRCHSLPCGRAVRAVASRTPDGHSYGGNHPWP